MSYRESSASYFGSTLRFLQSEKGVVQSKFYTKPHVFIVENDNPFNMVETYQRALLTDECNVITYSGSILTSMSEYNDNEVVAICVEQGYIDYSVNPYDFGNEYGRTEGMTAQTVFADSLCVNFKPKFDLRDYIGDDLFVLTIEFIDYIIEGLSLESDISRDQKYMSGVYFFIDEIVKKVLSVYTIAVRTVNHFFINDEVLVSVDLILKRSEARLLFDYFAMFGCRHFGMCW